MAALDLVRIRDAKPEGRYSKHETPGLIVSMARQHRQGRLLLKHGTALRALGYLEGRPVMVMSNVAAENLGAHLLEKGLITVAQASEIDALMTREKIQFGAAAIKLGVLNKAELAKALVHHRTAIIKRLIGIESADVTFDAQAKVVGDPSGVRLLAAIEDGIRGYPSPDIEALQAEIQEMRFAVAEGEFEFAHDLGCSPAVTQLLKMASGAARSFQELVASSEDDTPEIPVLTLLLTGILVSQSATARKAASNVAELEAMLSSGKKPALSRAEGPASSTAERPARPARATPPATASVREPLAPSAERSAVNLQDVDDLLSNLNTPSAAAARPVAPAPPRRPVDDLDLNGLIGPTAQPAPSRAAAPAPSRRTTGVPAQPPAGAIMQPITGVPLQPGTGVFGPPTTGTFVQPTSGVFAQPLTGTTPIPTTGVPLQPTTGVPYQPGTGIPMQPTTGVPDAVYALVPRDLLAGVAQGKRANRSVLFVAGAVLILLLGLGGGGAVAWFFARGGSISMAAPPHAEATPEKAAEPPSGASAEKPKATETDAHPTAKAESAPHAAADEEGTAPKSKGADKAATSSASKTTESKSSTSSGKKASSGTTTSSTGSSTASGSKPKGDAAESGGASPKPAGGASDEEVAFRLSIADKFNKQGQYRKAITVCTEILGMDPRNAVAYRHLGIAYAALGAKPQSCESYRRYLRFAPSAPDRAQVEGLLQSCQ